MMHMCCIAVSSWRQSFSDLQLDGCKGQVALMVSSLSKDLVE